MKKFFAIAMVALTIMAVGCKKEDDPSKNVDKTALTELLAQVQSVVNAATTATYPQTAIDAIKSTISEVQNAAESVTTSTQVASLVTRLQEALTNFLESAVDAVKTSQTIFKLSFDEGQGTTLTTTGKNAWTATFEGATADGALPVFVNGKVGKALQFSAGNHLVLKDADPSQICTNHLSISCWVKPAEQRAGNYIFSCNSWDSCKFQIQDSDRPFMTVHTTGGWVDADCNVSEAAAAGNWTHVVAAWDGEAGTMAFYINGEETVVWTVEGETSKGAGLKGSIIAPEDTKDCVIIGARQSLYMAGADAISDYFEGIIDEIAVYNVTLSKGQATKLYNDTK